MILISTHRRLADKGASIYKVSVPAQEVMGRKIPAYTEAFATLRQAEHFTAGYKMTPTIPVITKVAAVTYDAWTGVFSHE